MSEGLGSPVRSRRTSTQRMVGLVLGAATVGRVPEARPEGEVQAAGDLIALDALLDELGVPTERPAELELRLAAVRPPDAWTFERRLSAADEPWLRVAREPLSVVLRVEGICDARFELGRRELVLEPAPGATVASLAHAITDRLLPQLVGFFDRVSLHGSAVARRVDGAWRALGFVGPSGAGKSTLAASFTRAASGREGGAVLLADDTVVLACGDGASPPVVMPSSRRSRLHDDSLDALSLAPERASGREADAEREGLVAAQKATVRHARALAEPVPVDVLFVLEPVDAPSGLRVGDGTRERDEPPELERLTPREAIAALTEHLDRLDLADRAMLEAEIDRLVALARAVPVARLRHARSFEGLDELAARLEAFARSARAAR